MAKNADEINRLIASTEYLNSIEDILDKEMNKSNPRFLDAPRISVEELTPSLVEREVIQKGLPLVVSGVSDTWNTELFSWDWLQTNFGDWEMIASPRDTQSLEDLEGWSVDEYIDYIKVPAAERSRVLYGKDISCPVPWKQYLASHLNFYFCYEQRDLVRNLRSELQPETLMVYVGVENTYTPGHTDICGSLGHNLMVYSDPDAYAIWFIAKTSDKAKASKLWGRYGGALEHDNCFLPVEKLAEADFDFYVVKQRAGDFVLVPPDGAHQVINKGGRSIKIAWNRLTPSSLVRAYHNVLPLYHLICKAEVYRLKSLAFHSLRTITEHVNKGNRERRLLNDFPFLLELVVEILEEEWIDEKLIKKYQLEAIGVNRFSDRIPHMRTCNFCNNDIFNRCYRCPRCVDDYDVCLRCIAEGRGCKHNPSLELMEHFPISELRTVLNGGLTAYALLTSELGSVPKEIPTAVLAPRSQASVASLAFEMVQRYHLTEKVRCHQCKRRKRLNYMVECANGCAKMYCAMCLWNRYGVKQVEAERDLTWVCRMCTKNCNCAACLRDRGVDPKQHEVLAAYRALLEISVVVPPAFSRKSEAIPGVCDAAPKPGRSQGYSVAEMERAQGNSSGAWSLRRSADELLAGRAKSAASGQGGGGGGARVEEVLEDHGKALVSRHHSEGSYNIHLKSHVWNSSDEEEMMKARKKKTAKKAGGGTAAGGGGGGGTRPSASSSSSARVSEKRRHQSLSKPTTVESLKRKRPSATAEDEVNYRLNKTDHAKRSVSESENSKGRRRAESLDYKKLINPPRRGPATKKRKLTEARQRADPPPDFACSVLTFGHSPITHAEYTHYYRHRRLTTRKRIVNDGSLPEYPLLKFSWIYCCYCHALRPTAKKFAAHTKGCEVYRACTAPLPLSSDARFAPALTEAGAPAWTEEDVKPTPSLDEFLPVLHEVEVPSSPVPLLKTDDNFHPVFNRPVWAKVLGYPWWPGAVIHNVSTLPVEVTNEQPTPGHQCVYFFNETETPYCWILTKDIVDFTEYEEVFYHEIDEKVSEDWTDGQLHAYEDYRDFHLRERLLKAMQILRSHFPQYKEAPHVLVIPPAPI